MNMLNFNHSNYFLCFLIFLLVDINSKTLVCGNSDIEVVDVCVRTPYFFDSAFHGKSYAWVVPRAGGDLYLTRNGGTSWERVPGENVGGFGHISFINFTTGWAIRGRGIWKTQDSGTTWSEVSVLTPGINILRRPRQLLFINGTDGLILEAYKGIWFTRDGGKTWRIIESKGTELFKAYFSNSGHGIVTSEESVFRALIRNGGIVLKKAETQPHFPLNDAQFFTSELSWALSENSIYRSENGGETWPRVALMPTQIQGANLSSIHFISQQHGWSCGSKVSFKQLGNVQIAKWTGFIYKTNDGGRNWQLIYEKEGAPFDKVYFGDANNGWVLADDKVLKSIDGGVTWTEVLDMKSPSKCS